MADPEQRERESRESDETKFEEKREEEEKRRMRVADRLEEEQLEPQDEG
jgi:hypothetical protein